MTREGRAGDEWTQAGKRGQDGEVECLFMGERNGDSDEESREMREDQMLNDIENDKFDRGRERSMRERERGGSNKNESIQ